MSEKKEIEINDVLKTVAELAEELDKRGTSVEVAANAAIILAAQLCARLPNKDKEILEFFRTTFKRSRRKAREEG